MPNLSIKSFLAAITVATSILAAPAIANAQILVSGNARVEVELTEGVLLRLPEPVDAVFVADPGIADLSLKSPTLVYVRGNSAGQTNLFAVNADDEVIADIDIIVSHNISQLNHAISMAAPGSQIEAISVGKNVILTGTALSARHAQDAIEMATGLVQNEDDDGVIINQLHVSGPNQVNLRVRIAEVNRDVTKTFGVNLDVALNDLISSDTAIRFLSGDLLGALTGGFAGTTNTTRTRFNNGDVDVDAVLEALEENNLATILAEPNLTALSGETASFLAGGEVPIPVAQEGNVTTIEFREFGISLAFTPTILDSGHISLRVRPEVSTLDFSNAVEVGINVIPSFLTRRSETTVELGSGQSMAIAGLLQNDIDETISKYPGLGDIPILGTLFRSTNFQQKETELVIIVTPYLVRPISTVAAADPVSGLRPTNDYERVVHGRLYQERARGGSTGPTNGNAQGLVGPVGFVLD